MLDLAVVGILTAVFSCRRALALAKRLSPKPGHEPSHELDRLVYDDHGNLGVGGHQDALSCGAFVLHSLVGIGASALLGLLVCVVLVVVVVPPLENQLLFPSEPLRPLDTVPQLTGDLQTEEVWFADGNNQLHGLSLHSNAPAPSRPCIAILHPQTFTTVSSTQQLAMARALLSLPDTPPAGDAAGATGAAPTHAPSLLPHKITSVFVYDPPGTGRSQGKPSEQALLSASVAASRHAASLAHVKAGNLIHVGDATSALAAVHAASLAGARTLVLLDPVSSLDAVVGRHTVLVGAVVKHMLKNHLDAVSEVRGLEEDKLVPRAHVVFSGQGLGSRVDAVAVCNALNERGSSCEFHEATSHSDAVRALLAVLRHV